MYSDTHDACSYLSTCVIAFLCLRENIFQQTIKIKFEESTFHLSVGQLRFQLNGLASLRPEDEGNVWWMCVKMHISEHAADIVDRPS